MAPIHKTPSEEEIANTLGKLEISANHPEKPAQKPKSKPVADSWDEALSGSDTETEHVEEHSAKAGETGSPHDSLQPLSTTTSHDNPPNPPPPTPASPTQFEYPDNAPYSLSSDGPTPRAGAGGPDKRPEKTTAVAGRLIAGALGVRAPKRTDEEREYDRAMREKERKRRNEEREREKREAEAREARKKAVWDD
ncbi:ubiquitin-like protein smt3 protein [Stemphylium lycopersici]|uniref:Ubiquitin-like protein smt3 protein n=1 Tax=Stemphylium lycopersici TaxID=183478 RepID=A0A364N1L6_STELY|nr:ubiquitin-like protein smt3 protein [Stemphylium lycopersici]